MLFLFPGALLALALVASAAEAAEQSPVPNCSATPRIDLEGDSTIQALEVCITPGQPATFIFEASLLSGAVVVSDGRTVSFSQAENFVTVYPKRDFLPGERVKLTVSFGDGEAPEKANFWLVGHAVRGARQVEVFRHPRTADAFKREATEAQAEARQCQEDKMRILAEREEPSGLMSTAWLEREGLVSSQEIGQSLKLHSTNALYTEGARSYSHQHNAHPTSVALRLKLKNPGVEPWKAARALLVGSTGEEVELATWQELPILPSSRGYVVVGIQKKSEQFGCPCTLRLWEAQGSRTITLGNITFPASALGEGSRLNGTVAP